MAVDGNGPGEHGVPGIHPGHVGNGGGEEGEGMTAPTGAPAAAIETRRRLVSVDDDPMQGRMISALFRDTPGLEVSLIHDGAEALEVILSRPPDIVLLDLGLPGVSGLEILQRIKTLFPQLPVVVLTGFSDVRTAVQAIKLGAYQFLTKPVNTDELQVIVQRALEHGDLLEEIESLRRKVGPDGPLGSLVGGSVGMQTVVRRIRQVAASNFTVLIQGETGVGKELVARALHEESPRQGKPLIPIDCGAIPENLLESELFGHEKGAFSGADRRKEGLFVLADGGTIFLDEIANLPLPIQAKLLRVLQERKLMAVGATVARQLDVRFIAATNVSLETAVKEGKFRQDLFYRLAEFTIQVPPLRERGDDVLLLARRFREEATLELRRPVAAISEDACRVLRAHGWPGNVRELRNVIRQAVLLAPDSVIEAPQIQGLLSAWDAPLDSTTGDRSLKEIADAAAADAEKRAIAEVLQKTNGNKSQAARILKVDYKTLHLKVKRYGLGSGEI
jgi:DNA-binding NtrC family response regulator